MIVFGLRIRLIEALLGTENTRFETTNTNYYYNDSYENKTYSK